MSNRPLNTRRAKRTVGAMIGLAFVLGLCGVVPGPPLARGTDDTAAALFEQMFGAEIAAAKKTATHADDVDTARSLLKAAPDVLKRPAIFKRVVHAAIDLAAASPAGFATAIEATFLWEEHLPNERLDAIAARVPVRQRAYRSAKTQDEKMQAGHALLDDEITLAELYLERSKLAEAGKHVRIASSLSASARSYRREEIGTLAALVADRKRATKQAAVLKKRLASAPDDEAAARELILLYLVDLDTPAEARKYTFLVKDEALTTTVQHAGVEMSELSAADAMKMGDFYFALTREPGRSNQAGVYLRAVAYYRHWQSLKPDDASLAATKTEFAIGRLEKWLDANYHGSRGLSAAQKKAMAEHMDRITPRLLMDQLKNDQGREGINGWRKNANDDDGLPLVLVNASDKDLKTPQTVLARSVMAHPPRAGGAGIAWKSPSTGTFRIQGSVADAHACGNAVSWKLQSLHAKGHTTLASGSVEPEGASRFVTEASAKALASVRLNAGEMIQLVILPKGDFSCDLCRIDWTITEVGGRGRVWNLAKDIVADLHEKGEGNPHSDSHGNKDVWYFYEVPVDAAPE